MPSSNGAKAHSTIPKGIPVFPLEPDAAQPTPDEPLAARKRRYMDDNATRIACFIAGALITEGLVEYDIEDPGSLTDYNYLVRFLMACLSHFMDDQTPYLTFRFELPYQSGCGEAVRTDDYHLDWLSCDCHPNGELNPQEGLSDDPGGTRTHNQLIKRKLVTNGRK